MMKRQGNQGEALRATVSSAGCQACCVADCQSADLPNNLAAAAAEAPAGLATRDTADLAVCATCRSERPVALNRLFRRGGRQWRRGRANGGPLRTRQTVGRAPKSEPPPEPRPDEISFAATQHTKPLRRFEERHLMREMPGPQPARRASCPDEIKSMIKIRIKRGKGSRRRDSDNGFSKARRSHVFLEAGSRRRWRFFDQF
jgi:hypothetical protein